MSFCQTSPKLRNVISFGKKKQSIKIQSLHSQTQNSFDVRCQDSYQFDFGKQLNQLGVEVVNLQQQEAQEGSVVDSCNFNITYLINKQRLKTVFQTIRRNMKCMRQQLNSLRNFQQQFLNKIGFRQIQQKLKQKIQKTKLLFQSQSQTVQSDVQSCPSPTQKQKMINYPQSTTYSIQFKPYPYKNLNSSMNEVEKLQNEVQKLRRQNELKLKQIEMLKKESIALNNLYQKRESYFQEKLRLKQFQWNRKLFQIIKQYKQLQSSVNNQKDHQQNQKYANKTLNLHQSINLNLDKTQNLVQTQKLVHNKTNHLKINKGRAHTEANEPQNYSLNFNLIEFDSKINSPRQMDLDRLNHTITYTARNKSRGKNYSYHPLYENKNSNKANKIQQSLQLAKPKQRKQSTDPSFYKVNQKIKNFENQIRQEIQKINKK